MKIAIGPHIVVLFLGKTHIIMEERETSSARFLAVIDYKFFCLFYEKRKRY